MQESNFQVCLAPESVHLKEQHGQDMHYFPWDETLVQYIILAVSIFLLLIM